MSILDEAKKLKDVMISDRRYIHKNAEYDLDLPKTSAYVIKRLEEMGYDNIKVYGTSAVSAVAGKTPGKTFMIRGDMDALPMREESAVAFKSDTGNMHACGHDMHTAMMLAAARLLKAHEDELRGQVKLMFQPGEETLSGAVQMIDGGVMENPHVDAALMIHVSDEMKSPAGSVLIHEPDFSMAASDCFEIRVRGAGCHSASPHTGVDPLNVLCHIQLALQTINSREVPPAETIVLTIGQMHGGDAPNIIPDSAFMRGSIRTLDEETRAFVKMRVEEIVALTAKTFRAAAEVEFLYGTPSMCIDPCLRSRIDSYCRKLLGGGMVNGLSSIGTKNQSLGSEDFAHVSRLVPSVVINLNAAQEVGGKVYPLHHPRVEFNEDALPYGAAVYVNSAIEWLKENA